MSGWMARTRESAEERNAFEMPMRWWLVAGAGAVVAVSAAFGGLSPASRSVAAVDPSEPLVDDILTVQVHDAHTTDEIEEQFLTADPGETLLVIELTMENTWTEPLSLVGSADRVKATPLGGPDAIVQVEGVSADARAEFWRTDGTGGTVVLQPGVPVEVTAAWLLPEDDVSDEVTLVMHEADMRHGSVIIAHHNRFWSPGAAVQRTTVPVSEGR